MRKITTTLCVALIAAGCTRATPPVEPPPPAEGTLFRLCRDGEPTTDDARKQALAEVTQAVKAAGGDTDRLLQSLAGLAGRDARPAVSRGDADGDGQPDTMITFGFCGVPVMVYRAAAPSEPVLLPAGDHAAWHYGAGARVERLADVNGDGRPELVAEYHLAGASAMHTFLYIQQWQGTAFTTLFSDHLTSWVGENHWEVGDGWVSVQCHPMGPFEHKMTAHRQQTERYRWNAASGGYALEKRTREPASTRLLQIAEAESLFQGGAYAEAAAAYARVAELPPPEQPEPDWVAFAHLRRGQTHALAGQRADALAELKKAEAGGEPVSGLARAFRAGYGDGDTAGGFTFAWQWIRQNAFAGDGVLNDSWPFMLDPNTVGARSAILQAYQKAGQTPPADLPDEVTISPADCLSD